MADLILVTHYWLPTRAYSIIDAINRMAAATGSPRYAGASENADYNGHSVRVYFNDYRKYWLAEYTWAGRQVLARGSFEDCLRAAQREYDRGAKGASVVVETPTEAECAIAAGEGFAPYSKEIEEEHLATWKDARYAEVNEAFRYQRYFGVPAVGFLANSATVEEYKAKVDAALAERRAR